jgi:hypothetical protein
MQKKMSLMALLLAALLIPIAACSSRAPEKQAQKTAGKEPEPTIQAHSQSIVHDIVTVKAGGYHYYTVTVASGMQDARITGRFTASGGSGNDIIVLVLDSDGFTNWSNNHEVPAYYSSGKVTTGSLDVLLHAPGTYYLVLSNTFSTVTTKDVRANMDFDYKQ